MALQEMHRVLVPGGRLALSVLRDIQYNPYQRAIAEALGRHVSGEAAAVIHSPFAMGDAEELRSLTTTAGFRDVHLRLEIQVIRYAPVEELVMGYLAATPVAPKIASLDDTTCTAMLHDIKTALSSYMDDDGLAAPLDFRVVTGWK
jgi:hypothetical protein